MFVESRKSPRCALNSRKFDNFRYGHRLNSKVKYTAMCLKTSNSITRLLHCESAT